MRMKAILSMTLLLFLAASGCQWHRQPFDNQGIAGHIHAIDHVPVVVADLDEVTRFFSETLHFSLKTGKEHAGIKNSFIKFQDGSYLEFITPLDSTQEIGKYYTQALSKRQGGTYLAISVPSADSVRQYLDQQHIAYAADSNRIWKTLEPKDAELFYIQYSDTNRRDKPAYTSHTNGSLSMHSAWVISNDIPSDIQRYSTFGATFIRTDTLLNMPAHLFTVGKSELILLDAQAGKDIPEMLRAPGMQGVCGFTIHVSSLDSLNQLLPVSAQRVVEKNRTVYFLSDYSLFLVFTE
ncbi:MAG: hypothetical protein EAZ89_12455 [Bacteroidetes bacterium]|nr:MAG: hypothetical protein EAZ89_12455 [Bacteroidota bacterium]